MRKTKLHRRAILDAARIAACAAALGGLAVSGSPVFAQSESGVTATTIKIGMSAGITGPIAFASRQFSNYMQKYFDKVNAAGGVHGRKIELVVIDDGGKGNVALQNAQRLLQQDKVFAMSTVGTATTAGILDYLTKENVPLLFPGAYNTELITPTRANTFALYLPYEEQIAAVTKWVFGNKGPGTAVIVRANPPSFDLTAKSATATVEAGGGKVLATLNTTYNQPEWASIAIRLKELQPDYIIVITTASDMGRMWKEIAQQNILPKKGVIGISPLADQAFLDTSGGRVPNDMIFASVPATVVPTAPEAKVARDLVPGETMGLFGFEGVASAAVIVEALKQVGPSPTRAKLMTLLDKNFKPFKLPFMDTAKSAPNHLMIDSVGVSTVKDGKFVAATREFVK